MTVTTDNNDKICTMTIEGRIDSLTSAELSQAIAEQIPFCNKLILDLSGVNYVSSAGIRVIVAAHREMASKEGLVLRGLSSSVKTIISLTGFQKRLNIED